MAGQSFPKSVRLRRRAEFEAVQAHGLRISKGKMILLHRPRQGAPPLAPTRFGITASTKVGNAVQRNRLKRWLREWFRRSGNSLPMGRDLVIVLRSGALQIGHAGLLRDLEVVRRGLPGVRP